MHPDEEPAFFRAMLEAVVHAHVPRSDDHPRLRFIQFRHPDGFDAIPFFTSLEKARYPAGRTAKIVSFTGRQFLEFTTGATVMLNPDDGGCVLYPEEIATLLATGTIARVEKATTREDDPFVVQAASDPPTWLIPLLTATCRALPFIQAAYLLERVQPGNESAVSLVVALAVAPVETERAARAVTSAIQTHCATLKMPLDLTTFDPALGLPEYLLETGVEALYHAP